MTPMEERQRHCDDQRRLHDRREENRVRFAVVEPEPVKPLQAGSQTAQPERGIRQLSK